jgi:hypothetical protein
MIAPWYELTYAGPLIHQRHAYAVYLDGCETEERAPAGVCPCCGQIMRQPTPVKDANVAHEPPPSGWRDREPLA